MKRERLRIKYFGKENCIVYIEYKGMRYDIHYIKKGFYPNIEFVDFEYETINTYAIVNIKIK